MRISVSLQKVPARFNRSLNIKYKIKHRTKKDNEVSDLLDVLEIVCI